MRWTSQAPEQRPTERTRREVLVDPGRRGRAGRGHSVCATPAQGHLAPVPALGLASFLPRLPGGTSHKSSSLLWKAKNKSCIYPALLVFLLGVAMPTHSHNYRGARP